jgi:hypothetical protein
MAIKISKLTSSQRWAIGAVGIALLFACSPKAPEQPVQPPPQPQTSTTVSEDLASLAFSATTASQASELEPGYSGDWAFASRECLDPAKTIKLARTIVDMTPGERSCAIKSMTEEHPTGRSVVYTLKAACITEGATSEDTFKLNFGASESAMQLQLNNTKPVKLVRCP